MSEKDIYENRILTALRKVIRAVDSYSRKINTEFGLTTPQLLCLYHIAGSKLKTQSELAKEINLGGSTVNGIIDRLETKQYLKRVRSKEDKRKVYLKITEAGEAIVSNAPSLLQDKLSDALHTLPKDELLKITESLEKVVELMEVEKVDASPNLFPREQVLNDLKV